ncbi:MAG TPA: MFS transporter [Jatrophihabitans sp.]|uniref:MFS transporter n=1 Tax=Jatrophihabitans sp. TaxID=1932789 RepID=UPI002E049603|nr:MFS transporter [Jatrophihabitans sp.]
MLRQRPFTVAYLAEAQSIAGDQLARIALSVLVFDRTNSAGATALTYALTFLPAILGGVLAARVGDRHSRRAVMVGCDVARAALFALMAIGGLPLWVLGTLLVVAVFLGPVFAASEVSYLAAVLDPERFRVGTGLRLMTSQVAQVGGFAVGGVIISFLNPRGGLLVDAATYAVSAVAIGLLLPAPPRATPTTPLAEHAAERPVPWSNRSLLWSRLRVRRLIALCWLAGFFVIPEGLAVPFAAEIHATTTQAGLLLAAVPLGGAIGAIALVRTAGGATRETIAARMAIAAGLPLLVTAFEPPWGVALLAWAVSGALAAYQVEVNSLIVNRLPAARRSQLLGIIGAGLVGAQGIGVVASGVLADWWGAGMAVAVGGLAGSVVAAAVRWGPALRRPPRGVAVPAIIRDGDDSPYERGSQPEDQAIAGSSAN